MTLSLTASYLEIYRNFGCRNDSSKL